MKKNVIKKAILSASAIMLCVGPFIIGDYFALFGTSTNIKLDFREVRFRTLDAETNNLIVDVGVRCFQKNNNNACTRRESHKAGIVSVHMPIRRVIEKTFLFNKSEEIIKSAEPEIHIMFIHNDYFNTTESFLIDEVFGNNVKEYTVKMPPIILD